jgi:quercetin dioxygenase-like cupin family protein
MIMITTLILFLTAAVATPEPQWTQEVLLDNEQVLMVRNTFPPGQSSGQHSHAYPYRTVYVVQGGTIKILPADEQQPARTLQIETGSALLLPAQSHDIRNVGETTVVLIETELK